MLSTDDIFRLHGIQAAQDLEQARLRRAGDDQARAARRAKVALRRARRFELAAMALAACAKWFGRLSRAAHTRARIGRVPTS